MMVEIVCPHCGFSREVPRDKIPPRVKWATCPSCGNRFRLTGQEVGSPLYDQNRQMDPGRDMPAVPPPDREGRPRGFRKGWYHTAKTVLFHPGSFFRDLSPGRRIGETLAFGLLFGSIGAMVGWFWQFLMLFSSLSPLAEYFMEKATLGMFFIGVLVLVPLFVVLEMLFSTCILHVTLMIVGGAGQGFDATFKVMAYSQAPQLSGLIPFAGGMIGWIWQLVIRIIGLKEAHQTTYTRVITAFLLPVAVMFLVVAAVAVSVFFLI